MLNRFYSKMNTALESTKIGTLRGSVGAGASRFRNGLGVRVLSLNQRIFYHTFIRWIKHFFRAHIIHMKYHGKELDRPVVIVANHSSRWDPFFILSCAPKRFVLKQLSWRFPAMHKFFVEKRFVHWKYFLLWIGSYPIKKEGDLEKSLKKTIRILNKNQNVIFFPEGKVAREGKRLEPKKGISHLIERTNVYVLPVHISYSRKSKDGGGTTVDRSCVVFGKTIKSEYLVEKYSKEERHHRIMDEVYKLEGVRDKHWMI